MPVEWKEQTDTRRIRKKASGYSNTMLIHISGTKEEGREPYGEIVHMNLLRPAPFHGLAQLGFRIDEIARFLKLQGDTSPYRSLAQEHSEGTGLLPEEYSKVIPAGQRARYSFCQGMHLKKAQEIVRVELLGMQHMSLQGRIRCRSTGEKEVYFRSALELMYLFSEMMQCTAESHSPDGD